MEDILQQRRMRDSWLSASAACVLVAVAVIRIVSTYKLLNQTVDEPAHIGAGLEWLDRGSYLYGPDHPPLSRIAAGCFDTLREYG